MNLNAYRYTNADGEGPAYANLCVRAPAGTQFVDGTYHKYTIEWHTGDSTGSCQPHINFYFDDAYIGSVNVFVPTRGVRLVAGIWGGDANWCVGAALRTVCDVAPHAACVALGYRDGFPLWEEAYAYISSVTVTPFDEPRSTNYPQVYDEPSNHPTFTTLDIPAPSFPALRSGQHIDQPMFKAAAKPSSSLVVVVLVSAGIAVLVGLVVLFVVVLARHQRQRSWSTSTGGGSTGVTSTTSHASNPFGALFRSRLSTVAEGPDSQACSWGDHDHDHDLQLPSANTERSSLLVSVVAPT